MATPWTPNDIRSNASKWSLECDGKLLELLTSISNHVEQRANVTHTNIDRMSLNVDETSVSLSNLSNQLQALQHTKFVENRVYEEDVTTKIDCSSSADQQPSTSNADPMDWLKIAVDNSFQMMNKCYTKVSLDLNDSDDEDGHDQIPSIVFRPKDPYQDLPLPHLIGSKEWNDKWHIGLLDSDEEDDEMPYVKVDVDEYSDTSSDYTLPVSSASNDTHVTISESDLSNSGSFLQSKSNDEIQQISTAIINDDPLKSRKSVSRNPILPIDKTFNEPLFRDRPIPSIRKNVNLFDDDSSNEDDVPEINQPTISQQQKKPSVSIFHEQNFRKEPIISSNLFSDEPPELEVVPNDITRKTVNLFLESDDDLQEDIFSTIIKPKPNKKSIENTIKSPANKDVVDRSDLSYPVKPIETSKLPTRTPVNLFDDDDDNDFDSFMKSLAKPKVPNEMLKSTSRLFDDDPPEDLSDPLIKKESKSRIVRTDDPVQSDIPTSNPTKLSLFSNDNLFGDNDEENDLFKSDSTKTDKAMKNDFVINEASIKNSHNVEVKDELSTVKIDKVIDTPNPIIGNEYNLFQSGDEYSGNVINIISGDTEAKINISNFKTNLFDSDDEDNNLFSSDVKTNSQMTNKTGQIDENENGKIISGVSKSDNQFIDHKPPPDEKSNNEIEYRKESSNPNISVIEDDQSAEVFIATRKNSEGQNLNKISDPEVVVPSSSNNDEVEVVRCIDDQISSQSNIPPLEPILDAINATPSPKPIDYSCSVGLFDDLPPDDDDSFSDQFKSTPNSEIHKQHTSVFYDDLAQTLNENIAYTLSPNVQATGIGIFDDEPPPDDETTHDIKTITIDKSKFQDERSKSVSDMRKPIETEVMVKSTDQIIKPDVSGFRETRNIFSTVNKENITLPITVSSKPKVVPQKLNVNLNINVKALLPGAKLQKSVSIETDTITPKPVNDEVNIFSPSLTNSSIDVDPNVVESDTSNSNLLIGVNKSRTRVPTKRRPSTRRGRINEYRKSLVIDIDGSDNSNRIEVGDINEGENIYEDRNVIKETIGTQNCSEIVDKNGSVEDVIKLPNEIKHVTDESLPPELPKPKKSFSKFPPAGPLPPLPNIFDDTNDEEDFFKTFIKPKPKIDNKPPPNQIANMNEQKPNVPSTQTKNVPVAQPNEAVTKRDMAPIKSSSLFDDDDDDDLFGVGYKSTPKPSTFQSIAPKKSDKPSSVNKKVSLFGDSDDSDDDLFGTKSRIEKTKSSKTPISNQKSKTPPTVYDDPLADILHD